MLSTAWTLRAVALVPVMVQMLAYCTSRLRSCFARHLERGNHLSMPGRTACRASRPELSEFISAEGSLR